MALDAGTRLGPYEVVGPIDNGGAGEVYKATDTRLDRTVAPRMLPPRWADDPEARERLERHAESLAALSHPHICTLHDIGRERVQPARGAGGERSRAAERERAGVGPREH